MRVFFAMELEESLKDDLYSMQQEIKKYTKTGVFSRKENFHITVKFMGEMKREEVLAISKAINLIPKEEQSVEITTEELGCFQRGLKAVLWMGIDNNPALNKLQKKLDGIIETFGYERESRAFHPHITLGRQVAFRKNFDEIKALSSSQKHMVCEGRLCLMESKRIDGTLTYSKVMA